MNNIRMAKQVTAPSSKPPRTEAQRIGIYDRSGSLVVSASAGTGKTTVLTDRCVDLITGKDPIEIDRLLVVTFTEAAAQEMRERIRTKLREMHEARGGSRLARQIALLDASSISTLHSFCLQVVRENFSLAGIEPDAGVLDDDEAQLLKDEVMGELFEGLYGGQGEQAPRFGEFVANYGQGRDDRIREQIKRLHEYLRSLPPPRRQEWKQRAVAAYALDAGGMLTAAQFEQLRTAILDEIDLMMKQSSVRLQAFEQRVGPHRGLDNARGVHEFAAQMREELGKVTSPASLKAWTDRAGVVPWGRMKSWRDVPGACKGWAEWLKIEWKKVIGERWVASAEAWAHGMAITAPYAGLLIQLVDRFAGLYSRQKRRIGRIDYSDMEEHAFGLLAGGEGQPSEIARGYQQRYDVVLVDEFQDINPIQAAIVHLVGRESAEPPQPNLFVVGDVKQSIYGFRMTDPELFRGRQQRIEAGEVAGRCVSLQENFRSRGEVLAFVNRVFGKLMQGAETQVGYDAAADAQGRPERLPGGRRSDGGVAPAGRAIAGRERRRGGGGRGR